MESKSYTQILQRIHCALDASRAVFARFTPGAIETEYKIGHDPVTEADRALDAVLRKELLRDGEGWLSEESVDAIRSVCSGRECGWSIRSTVLANSSKEFPSSAPP